MYYFLQIIDLCELKDDASKKAHAIIDKFADRGLRSLAVARQVSFYFPSLILEHSNLISFM
jgi:hypothetical protein